MSDPKVLVSGASIAGPALAHWLHRHRAEVTVVEQTPGLRPGGQAVDARGVAKEVIRRMGLDTAVRAACTDTAGAYTVDVNGKVLETYRADDDSGDGYIAEIEILRGDLSLALVGAYLLAGELAAADWDPQAGFAGYEERMRAYVEANQEIGRLHVHSLTGSTGSEPGAEPDMEALTALIELAVGGPELPKYEVD